MTGNPNTKTLAEFSNSIQEHINNPGIDVIQGTYRGTQKVTHFYDPSTGLWVARDEAGNFVAGWKLGADQLENLYRTGNVQ